MGQIIGIDLGTTNSLCAYHDGERPLIIESRAGGRSTPSIVAIDDSGKLVVGKAAREAWLTAPGRAVAEVKRLMGSAERVRLGGESFTPTECSAAILRTLKEDAEAFFGAPVAEAVVTVPAYFTDAQRQATKDAGELAGLRVERILNEPTAAALAYGLGHLDAEQYVAVYDLGGGTFDVSVLEMFEGVLDVKAAAGNNLLGGGDIDRALATWLREGFERGRGVDIRADIAATTRLKAAAEQAKIELSKNPRTRVTLPNLATKDGVSVALDVEVTRADLERLADPFVRATFAPIDSALADARLDKRRIDEIVLVGGSTRMPLVRRLVAAHFGKEPRDGLNPEEAVALGAAVQAALKTGGISTAGGIMITDVSPFTLGVEASSRAGSQRVEGVFSPIIPRNSTIPVSKTETYATTSDGQRQVDIRVYQGEAHLVRNNLFLDAYTVGNIPAAPAGHEKIAVTFTYDVNGILEVTTKVLSTGKQATLKIEKSASRMTADDRGAARARLDGVWAPSASAARAAPAAKAEPADVEATRALIAAARARRTKVSAADALRVDAAVAALEAAALAGDAVDVGRRDAELTELLFDLG